MPTDTRPKVAYEEIKIGDELIARYVELQKGQV